MHRQAQPTRPTDIRSAYAAGQSVELLADCHATLTSHGASRLEREGWRSLGIGSLPAASPGFRCLALRPARNWVTYESRDHWAQTVAEVALCQPHWFAPPRHGRIEALGASRLDLYAVVDDGAPNTTLRCLRNGRELIVNAFLDNWLTTPARGHLVARVVRDRGRNVLVDSAVISSTAARLAVRGAAPCNAEQWSRRLLAALLGQFVEADLAGRGTTLEPQLGDHAPANLARLHRALRSLECALNRRYAPIMHHYALDGCTLTAERRGSGWRMILRGARQAVVERVPTEASHPVDAEMMRQIGASPEDGVLHFDGAVDELATACARAAVARRSDAA